MKNRWSKRGVRAYQMGKWSATEGQLQRQTCVARIPSFYLKTQSPFSSCHFDPPIFISTLTLSFRPLGEISTFGVAQQYVPSSRNSNLEVRNTFKYLKTKTHVYISRHAPFETFEFWISGLFRISIFGFRVGGKGKATNPFNVFFARILRIWSLAGSRLSPDSRGFQ